METDVKEFREDNVVFSIRARLESFGGGFALQDSAAMFAHHPLYVNAVAIQYCWMERILGPGLPQCPTPRERYGHEPLQGRRQQTPRSDGAGPKERQTPTDAG